MGIPGEGKPPLEPPAPGVLRAPGAPLGTGGGGEVTSSGGAEPSEPGEGGAGGGVP